MSTTATETTVPSPAPLLIGDGRTRYRDAVWAEYTKFATLRSNLVMVGVIAAVLPLFAVIVAVTESLQPDDTILGASVLGGGVIAQMLAAALGSMLITNEFRTGLIYPTLAACPRRSVVLTAKATVVAGTVFAATLIGACSAFAIGAALLEGDYAIGEPWPALVGVALAVSLIAVLGVGLGTIVRHTAAGIGAAIGVVLLPGFLAPMLGDAGRWLGGASLSGVMQKLTQSSDATHEAVGSLGAWPSLSVVAIYTAATMLGATWVLRHRDA